jgi:hypothetical protein
MAGDSEHSISDSRQNEFEGQNALDKLFPIFPEAKPAEDRTAEAAAGEPPGPWWQRAWTKVVAFVQRQPLPTKDGPASPAPLGDSLVDVEHLEDPTKWAARGFTALTAVLLFFGIKDGVLDQALRLNPRAALWVFLLLGVGALAALFAPSINKAREMRWWALIVALGLVFVVTALCLPDLEIDETWPWPLPPWLDAGFAHTVSLLVAGAVLLRTFVLARREGASLC